MATRRWFYIDNGEERGPLSDDELQALARSGAIDPGTLVRTDGMTAPVAAGKVRGLFAQAAAAQAAATKPAAAPPAAAAAPLFREDPPAAAAPAAAPLFREEPPARPRSLGLQPKPATEPRVRERRVVLEAPDWHRLWPLAVLTTGFGWVIGGWLSFDRWYLPGSVLPVLLLALGTLPAMVAAAVFYLRPPAPPAAAWSAPRSSPA